MSEDDDIPELVPEAEIAGLAATERTDIGPISTDEANTATAKKLINNTDRKIPITLLTGFLGSGKTTLLNYILTQHHGKRIAVVENEFSAGLGIESIIAKNGVDMSTMSGFFELNNGCICCTVKDDLVTTLEQLASHKDNFDYILIEATGVADPGPILASLWVDEEMDTCLRLDGVVTVVDAKNVGSLLADPGIYSDVAKQIAYADRVLINKIDISSEEEISKAEDAVRGINGLAELQRCTFSRVDVQWVLDLKRYSLEEDTPAAATMAALKSNSGSLIASSTTCGPANAISHTTVPLSTISFSFGGNLSFKETRNMMDSLLYNNGTSADVEVFSSDPSSKRKSGDKMSIFRIKAALHIENEENLFILQGVHDIFDLKATSIRIGSALDTTGGLNKVIVIGRSLDAYAIEEKFIDCIAN